MMVLAVLAWLLVPSSAVPDIAFEEPQAPKLSAAEAYELIRPSVVHVRGYAEGEDEATAKDERQSGTGVIIARYRPSGPVRTGSFAHQQPSEAELARRERMKKEG